MSESLLIYIYSSFMKDKTTHLKCDSFVVVKHTAKCIDTTTPSNSAYINVVTCNKCMLCTMLCSYFTITLNNGTGCLCTRYRV